MSRRCGTTSRFRAVDPAVMAYFRPLADAAVAFVDKALEGRDWLVGDGPTIADIGCWGRMVFMAEGGMEIARWPNVQAWSRRLAALPGFALPYDLISEEGSGDRSATGGGVFQGVGRTSEASSAAGAAVSQQPIVRAAPHRSRFARRCCAARWDHIFSQGSRRDRTFSRGCRKRRIGSQRSSRPADGLFLFVKPWIASCFFVRKAGSAQPHRPGKNRR